MNGVEVVRGGSDGTHNLSVYSKVVGRYRGVSVALVANSSIATISIRVFGGQSTASPLIRSLEYEVEASKRTVVGELLDLDNGISTGNGLFIEVVVVNAIAASINALGYFNEEYV